MAKVNHETNTGIKVETYPEKTVEEIKEMVRQFNKQNNPAFEDKEKEQEQE